jgi:hypothetical protein
MPPQAAGGAGASICNSVRPLTPCKEIPPTNPGPRFIATFSRPTAPYIIPVGKGTSVDFGKWGSSLGIEGNYSKDQINYSRAYWFDFLPFYHMGVRVSAPISDRFTLNYWVVNGTNQVEATQR